MYNYLKHYIMIYFVQFIWDYKNLLNYNIEYSEIVYKYLLKAFYKGINKKKYKLQILKYNICHTNIIAMQNIILTTKVLNRSVKKLVIINISDIKVTQMYNTTNVLLKYN